MNSIKPNLLYKILLSTQIFSILLIITLSIHFMNPNLRGTYGHVSSEAAYFFIIIIFLLIGTLVALVMFSVARSRAENVTGKIKKALIVDRDYLRSLIDIAPVIILSLDTEANIVSFNKYIEKLTGYGLSEVSGKNWFKIFIPGYEHSHVTKVFKDTLSSIPTTGTINPITAKDGREIQIEWYNSVLKDENGDIVGLLGIGQDISERLKTERKIGQYSEQLEQMVAECTEELTAAQEMLVKQEKLAIMGQVAGSVSHELRNPLGVISNASYILGLVTDKSNVKAVRAMAMLDESVKSACSIIETLLDFGRPKVLLRIPFDMNDETTKALSRVTRPANVEVIKNIGASLPIITGDAEKIIICFMNLIRNAYQAMPDGGRLNVSAETSQAGWVSAVFSDDGKGVAGKNIPRLFEPLFTTKARGIGLGLSLSRTIIEMHGGSIDFKNNPGRGACFTVNLPISHDPGKVEDKNG